MDGFVRRASFVATSAIAMDFHLSHPACPVCGTPLGPDVSFCVLCSRAMCAHHLLMRKGVGICGDCQEERLSREASGAGTDADEARIVTAVCHDVVATVGAEHEHVVVEEAARVRLFASTLAEFERQVVDDVQQRLHDERVDTTWPSCPRHANHPLWYADGWWRCRADGQIARLGCLSGRDRGGA
mgnify:CR=1 FL=1